MYFDPGTTKLPELGSYPMQPELAAKMLEILEHFDAPPDEVTADLTGNPVCVWRGRNEVQIKVIEVDAVLKVVTFPGGHIEAETLEI